MSSQPHPDLNLYLNGTLTPDESTDVETHLESCDECLALLDDIWGIRLTKAVDLEEPAMPDSTARAIENRLLNQIHRSDLGGQAIQLGTRGFFQVLLAIIKPFLSFTSAHKQERSSQ